MMEMPLVTKLLIRSFLPPQERYPSNTKKILWRNLTDEKIQGCLQHEGQRRVLQRYRLAKARMGNESGKIAIHGLGQNPDNEGDLQAITHFEKTHLDDINFEANPLLLMPDRKGYSVRLGHNLAGVRSRLQSEFGQLLIVCVPFDVCITFALMELSAAHFLFFFFLIPNRPITHIERTQWAISTSQRIRLFLQETEAGSRANGDTLRTQSAPHRESLSDANHCEPMHAQADR
jgi:hypothetical protein